MASPYLCKPPMASGPASRVKPVTKQTFGRTSPETAREAAQTELKITSGPKSNFEIQASRTKGEFDGSSVNIVGM